MCHDEAFALRFSWSQMNIKILSFFPQWVPILGVIHQVVVFWHIFNVEPLGFTISSEGDGEPLKSNDSKTWIIPLLLAFSPSTEMQIYTTYILSCTHKRSYISRFWKFFCLSQKFPMAGGCPMAMPIYHFTLTNITEILT